MAFMEAGHTYKQTHELFKVSVSTLQDWRKLVRETGKLEKRELKRSFKKVDPEKLAAYIAEQPDAYLKEIAEGFKCCETAIGKALKKLNITRKKKRRCTKSETK